MKLGETVQYHVAFIQKNRIGDFQCGLLHTFYLDRGISLYRTAHKGKIINQVKKYKNIQNARKAALKILNLCDSVIGAVVYSSQYEYFNFYWKNPAIQSSKSLHQFAMAFKDLGFLFFYEKRFQYELFWASEKLGYAWRLKDECKKDEIGNLLFNS